MQQKNVILILILVGVLWISSFKEFPQQRATDDRFFSSSSCICAANSLAFIPCQTEEGSLGISIFQCIRGCNLFSEYSSYYNGHWENYRRCLTPRQFINEGWSEKISHLLYVPMD